MVSILRNFIKGKLTNHVCLGPVPHDPVGLQFHWSIIEEFGRARQDLTSKTDTVVRFHGLDLDINVHFAGAEQELARWCSHATYPGKHRLIKCIKYERSDEFG